MSNSVREKAATGIVWSLLERFGAQGVSIIVTIVLARLLDPEVYGVVALATVFTSLLEPLINSGMSNRLVQKKDADDLDFSTYFYYNMSVGIIIYVILFFAAPYIANFYHQPVLGQVIRVIGINVIVYGVKGVQSAYVSRNMLFRKFFFATLGGTVGAAALGIYMAYNGYGVWALVCQNLFNNIVDTIILWFVVKWRPKFLFSFDRLRDMLSYGWKFLTVNITNTIVDKIRSLIIGREYSAKDLAFYEKGNLFPDALTTSVEAAMNSVIFPSLATVQDNKESLKSMLKRSIKLSMFILSPINFGLIACGKPLVSLILTEKWLPCLPFLYIFCLRNNFTAINVLNQNVYKATGKARLYLRIDNIKKIINLVLLFICMWLGGIIGIALSMLFSTFAYILLNTMQNKKDLGYGLFEQILDMLPPVVLSIIMAIPVYCIQLIGMSAILTLIIQIVLGIFIYVFLSAIFKIESFYYVLGLAKSFVTVRKQNEESAKNHE